MHAKENGDGTGESAGSSGDKLKSARHLKNSDKCFIPGYLRDKYLSYAKAVFYMSIDSNPMTESVNTRTKPLGFLKCLKVGHF